MKKYYTLLLFVIFSVNFAIGQISISSLPNLSRINVTEVTNTYHIHSFTVYDSRMLNRLGAALSNTNDFGGVPGAENYDIYYSDAVGNLDVNGAYITIECRYLGNFGGGAMNIAHVELEFNNGFRISPDMLSRFYAAGNNYLQGSELNAVDCDPITFTTMGNNSATPNTMFLSLTFDFSNIISKIELVACEGDGFEYISGNTVFNESNPSGVGYIDLFNGCNMIELVEIDYSLSNRKSYTYNGCKGDNHSIIIGGVTFDEDNPEGQVSVPGSSTCDTIYHVKLNFEAHPMDTIKYNGCKGDNYSIIVGGVTFDEDYPEGQVFVSGSSTCDTIYHVKLNFEVPPMDTIKYNGCKGDNYSILVGGITFNEQNPEGQVLIPGSSGCDTIFQVRLDFEEQPINTVNYSGCKGDNYSINIGGVIFNEQNPQGQVFVSGSSGCDTIYIVQLDFLDQFQKSFVYNGCQGDMYSINIGGVTFNEQNPEGQVSIPNSLGCDTIYQIRLNFESPQIFSIHYNGCKGDNYSINIGGVIFNEQNPEGQVSVPGSSGCDTIYHIQLIFEEQSINTVNYNGCKGDNYSIIIGGITFNEQNPIGQIAVPGSSGCDRLYQVQLNFEDSPTEVYTYNGCQGDNHSINIGGIIFNEQNPIGQVFVPGISGCDTIIQVRLNFEDHPIEVYNYSGCKGEDFEINIGGVTFNELNPHGQVFVQGNSGCDTIYNVQLYFNNCKICKLHYPNIIKSYGSNNEFKIIYADDCDITDPQLSIYDRWGNLVYFEHTNVWNGKFGTANCVPGVYVFVFKYRIADDQFQIYGDVTVLE